MNNIYFTSDTHFGHKNVIKYCNRPYSSVEEMDDALCENWNHTVKPGDTVYHLGDIAFGRSIEKQGYYLMVQNKLNGVKHFVRGNHDESVNSMKSCGLDVLNPDYGIVELPEFKFLLSHKPLPNEKIPEGWVNIHGHIHNGPLDPIFDKNTHYCVCVDLFDYKPVSLQDILRDLNR